MINFSTHIGLLTPEKVYVLTKAQEKKLDAYLEKKQREDEAAGIKWEYEHHTSAFLKAENITETISYDKFLKVKP